MHRGIAAAQVAEDVAAMSVKKHGQKVPAMAGAEPESREQMMERKRAAARKRQKEKRERIRSTVTGNRDAAMGRLRGVPRAVEVDWEITSGDIDSFDRWHGISKILDDLGASAHPDDRSLIFNGLAAAFAFHDLSRAIDELDYDDGVENVAYELKRVRVGFELAMQALDRLLNERGLTVDKRSLSGKARWARDPTQAAKRAIEAEWKAWQAARATYRTPKDFRIAMLCMYPAAEDGTLRNWLSQWGKAAKESRS